jgi:hypothetical protein
MDRVKALLAGKNIVAGEIKLFALAFFTFKHKITPANKISSVNAWSF